MRAVAEIAEPGLEGRGVVFLDDGSVGDDFRGAGDGGPFAGVVEEGDVDVGVGGDARGRGVRLIVVRDEGKEGWGTYSSVLPDSVLVWKMRSTPPPSYFRLVLVGESNAGVERRTLAANAIHLDTKAPLEP